MSFNDKDKAILIGLALGDGYIDPKGRLCIEHGEKQKEYCEFKAKLLHSVLGGNDVKVYERIRKYTPRKDGKEWKTNFFKTYSFTKSSVHLKKVRELLYKDNKKTITEELVSHFDLITLLLLYLDDGNLHKHYNYTNRVRHEKFGYQIRIYTYLPKDQNEILQKWIFDKYGIMFKIAKAYGTKKEDLFILRCCQTEARKFLNLIREYVRANIPSMAYKVLDI